MYRFMNRMKETWILQEFMAHQEEKSHHKVEEDMKEMKDQEGHHKKTQPSVRYTDYALMSQVMNVTEQLKYEQDKKI